MGARCYYLYWKLDHVEFTLALFTFSLALLRPQAAVVVDVVGFPFFVHGWLQQTTTTAEAAGRGSSGRQRQQRQLKQPKHQQQALSPALPLSKAALTYGIHTHT